MALVDVAERFVLSPGQILAAPVTDGVPIDGFTVMVPVAVTVPHPPVKVTVYVNAPDTVGVPLMVTTFDAQPPVTPAGNPVIVAPVAPVVA